MTGSVALLDAVYESVAERSPLVEATVDRVTVGDRLVLVETADGAEDGDGAEDDEGAAGVAHRPPGVLDDDLDDQPILEVARWAVDPTVGDGLVARAVGVAALNALSAPLVEWSVGDPFEALAADVSTIATVGLFGPAFRKFGAVDVRVIEQRDVEPPETPEGVSVSVYGPDEAATAIEGADAVFVTGSTLLYGGTERYLEAARGVPDVVLIGATASFAPEPAFDAGATMLAGARATDAGAIRPRIRAGECATDLHDEGLEKVYVTSGESPNSALDLG